MLRETHHNMMSSHLKSKLIVFAPSYVLDTGPGVVVTGQKAAVLIKI